MLKMFTADAFSVCLSLCQAVTDVILFAFWFITQKYSFLQNIFIEYRIVVNCRLFVLILYFYMFVSVFYMNFDC